MRICYPLILLLLRTLANTVMPGGARTPHPSSILVKLHPWSSLQVKAPGPDALIILTLSSQAQPLHAQPTKPQRKEFLGGSDPVLSFVSHIGVSAELVPGCEMGLLSGERSKPCREHPEKPWTSGEGTEGCLTPFCSCD